MDVKTNSTYHSEKSADISLNLLGNQLLFELQKYKSRKMLTDLAYVVAL